MVAHFSACGGRKKLHAPLATFLHENLFDEKVAKEPNKNFGANCL